MVPLVDLKAQYASVRDEIIPAVTAVLDSGNYILGPEVAGFEKEFAAYCGAKHAVAVNSGTSALHLALLAAGVGEGDEVITVPFTFVATVAAIRYTSARPVLVDVDPVSYTMNVEQLEKAITPKTKAIIPVHLYGQPANMDEINGIASRRGIAVIEDSAQAHGSTYKGRRAGSLGQFGCFSFYPTKNLGACGEGGIVTTSDDEGAKKLRMLRDWGMEVKNQHVLKGFNYRLEGFQGAILRIKLRRLEQWIEQRRAHARFLDKALAGAGVTLPVEAPDNRHVYHLYVVRTENRDEFQKALADRQIGTAVHYPIPVHLQKAHEDLGYKKGDFPVSEEAAATVCSLPMYAELTQAQLEEVAEAVCRVRSLAAAR